MQQLVTHAGILLVARLAGVPMPFMQPQSANAHWVVTTLSGPGDEAVERDGQMTRVWVKAF
jgi:hypothetical protein